MQTRRETVKSLIIVGALVPMLPERWSRPLVTSVITPAHAQTSGCSGFTDETINESISITVTDTTVEGPIVAPRSGTMFADTQTSVLGGCGVAEQLNVRVEFNGEIDSAANSISGTINILQTCGADFVCEQLSTFTADQTPAAAGDNGTYVGTVVGTLRCCDDFST